MMYKVTFDNILFMIGFGVPIFFLFRFILSKLSKHTLVKNLGALLGTMVITPFVYGKIFILLISLLLFDPYIPKRFKSKAWQSKSHKRFEMAGHLVKSELLIGKDTTELLKLLGHPHYRKYDTLWIYDMGSEMWGVGIQFHQLNISLKSNRVRQVEHEKIID